MNLNKATVLVTGGATGIGLAIAGELLEAGSTVIICGRREAKLTEAKARFPGLETMVADVGEDAGRRKLAEQVVRYFPQLNVLVNNAGIQREINFAQHPEDALTGESEIAINLDGTVQLTALLMRQLLRQTEAAVVNVSSGLGFVPMALAPVYCATKAGLHSFSITLRYQLRHTPVKVFEVIPPIVATALDRGARQQRGQKQQGISPEQVAVATVKALKANRYEIAVGLAAVLRMGSRLAPGFFFGLLNRLTQPEK